MQTWAVISQKGGAGKTTIAIHLAVIAEATGLRTTLIDVDPQASASSWARIRDADSPQVEACLVSNLRLRLKHLASLRELTIVDTSPRADRDATDVARLADVIIVPVQPSVLDLPAVEETMQHLTAGGLADRAFMVLNRCAPRTGEAEEAAAVLSEIGTLLPIRLGERVDFRRALTAGKGITEYRPTSAGAKEMRALYDEITRRST
jgi:chromosome partitioning protein